MPLYPVIECLYLDSRLVPVCWSFDCYSWHPKTQVAVTQERKRSKLRSASFILDWSPVISCVGFRISKSLFTTGINIGIWSSSFGWLLLLCRYKRWWTGSWNSIIKDSSQIVVLFCLDVSFGLGNPTINASKTNPDLTETCSSARWRVKVLVYRSNRWIVNEPPLKEWM